MAIFTAIGTAIAGALFAGSAFAATLIGTGLAFAANIGMQYLRRPKARKYSAIQAETRYGGDVPVGTLYGTGSTKGQRIFYAKYDRGNKMNAEVFVLANGWCDGLEPYVYVYGQKRALIPTTFPESNQTAAYFVEGFTNHVRILFFDGRPGQTVDQHLVNVTAGLGQTWKSTSVCAGQAYVVVYREYNADLFSQGKPEFDFVLRGLKEYDPRKDSTVAGGSGAQRINNPATWTHTKNPAVHRLNYQLGLKGMVSGRTLVGEGKSIGQLDLGTYFVAMNVCDSLRADGKKRYECSLWVNGDDDHTEVLKEFDDAMAGYGLNRRGLSGVIAGAPQIPVMEITADDIPADRAKDIQFRKSAFERYNHLSGQFTSIEAMWQPESLTPIYVNADVAEDGGRIRQTSNDFLQVSDPDLAQYLLTIRYRQNRKGGTATLPISRRAGLQVQEGEWIEWRGREWMISEWVSDEQFRITLKLTETGADIYDDDDIEPGPVVIPPTPPVNPSLLSTVQNFNVEPWALEGANGYRVPALRFSWLPPSDPTIVAVAIEYRKEGETEVAQASSDQPESGELIVTSNVVPGKVYEARATIRTVPDRLKTWTPYATTAEATPDLLIVMEYLAQEIRESLETLQDWIDSDLKADLDLAIEELQKEVTDRTTGAIEAANRYRSLLNEIATIRNELAEQDFANFRDREELRRTVTLRLEGAFASFDERITVAVSETAAVAQRVTDLQAEANQLNARITTVDQARVQGEEALAEQLALLSVGTDNQFDPFKLWNFNGGVDGWTGNGDPVAANGFLRPAAAAANPYVDSPAGLGVPSTAYRQVRLRIRKVGAPVWVGYLWWKAAGDAGFDIARRSASVEPAYDGNGIGLITFNPEWSGTIDQIRVELSVAQTATDYFTIDWISIGSPSPGASRAELAAERQARIDGDSAIASDVLALEAGLNDQQTGLSALAGGVEAIEVQVNQIGADLVAQGQALTALDVEVDGKAGLDVVNQLAAEIEALGGGGIVSQGSALTAIRNSLFPLASEALDQGFADFLGRMDGLKVSAEASNLLDTKIEATNTSLDILSRAVVQVQAVIPGLAMSTALSALTTRVTATESSLTSLSSAVTQINSDLTGKASTSALSALTTRVTEAEGAIASVSSAVTQINSDLTGKASTSALNALTTRVTNAEGSIQAISESLTAVEAVVDGVSANSTFRMAAVSGPSGYARIAAQARVNTSEGYRTAGWFLDVPVNAALPTQFLVNADRFAILNGSNKTLPFVFEDGVLKLAVAHIVKIESGEIAIGKTLINSSGITVSV